MTIFNSSRITSDNEKGFTLIELLVATSIIALLSVIIITGFSRSRVDLLEGSNFVTSIIRTAQGDAVASVKYSGYNPCGYGVHYIDDTRFAIYVGPDAATADCTVNRNYDSGKNSLLATQLFTNSKIHFMSSFSDIYFEPPDPKTYIDNNSALNGSPALIIIGKVGGTCPQDCKTIYVYPSGKIERP